MSITRQATVWCDLCGSWVTASTTAALRKDLKEAGWSTVKHYSVRDYCPICTSKRAKALAEMLEKSSQEIKNDAIMATERSHQVK